MTTNEPTTCGCACHVNVLKKPYEHDSMCCTAMNGYVHREDDGYAEEICGAIIHVGFEGATTCGELKKGCVMHDPEARERFMANALLLRPSEISSALISTLAINEMKNSIKTRLDKILAENQLAENVSINKTSNPFALGHSIPVQTLNTRDAPIEPSKEKVSEPFLPDDICKCGHEWMWHVHKDIPIRKCTPYPNQCNCVSFEKKVGEAGKGWEERFDKHFPDVSCWERVMWHYVGLEIKSFIATEIATARAAAIDGCIALIEIEMDKFTPITDSKQWRAMVDKVTEIIRSVK